MDRPLVVLDTEHAALRGAPHLIELAAIRVVDGEVQETFDELVRPEIPIEPEATEIHGISDEDVRSARDAGSVLADFFAWLGDDWVAAHRAESDASTLAFEWLRHHPPGPGNGLADLPGGLWIDTLPLARRLIPEAHDHRLDTLASHLELEHANRHRALADAVTCWRVIEECMARLGDRSRVTLAELVAQAGRPLALSAAAPRPPLAKPAVRKLEVAAREGAEVQLVYGGAGEEPAELAVRPRLLYQRNKKGYLEGECLRSGLLKTYRLDRVRRVR